MLAHLTTIRQMEWIANATDFFVGCLPNATDDDFDAAIDCAIHAYRLGHSGARCIFFGYDLARTRINNRAAQ
jgi:hypothetical protein